LKAVLPAIGAVVYFVNPMDVTPDLIPLVGFIDDGIVLAAVMPFLKNSIMEYRRFRKTQGKENFFRDETLEKSEVA